MISARKRRAILALSLGAAVLIPAGIVARVHASDHADTPAIAATPGADLTDVFAFPDPNNANNVVLVMNVHPLIPTGQGTNTFFDPNVLYQFKIDNTGDFVEDKVIQVKFTGTGPTQKVTVTGPVAPNQTGTSNTLVTPDSVVGTYNVGFTTSTGSFAFCGPREDPFFFDLNQFFTILPDRANPLGPTVNTTTGATVSTTPSNPDAPQAASFRPKGQAQDFLKGFNVLSIVVSVPKTQLQGTNGGKVNLWCTTSI